VKRDPHVLDLVLFLHPKKCLTCGEKFALLLVLETVPGTSSEPKLPEYVSGIFASFSRALKPWAVQNIQKGKKVVKSCRANRNV